MKNLAVGLILLFAFSSVARAAEEVSATGSSAGTSGGASAGAGGSAGALVVTTGAAIVAVVGVAAAAVASSSGGANPTVAHGGSTPGSYPTAARILCTGRCPANRYFRNTASTLLPSGSIRNAA